MHKQELIARLRSKVLKIRGAMDGNNKHRWSLGQFAFANFLIYYFENLHIPSDEKYDFWNIEPYLPELMVDAFEQLRKSDDDEVIRFRKMFEEDTGHEVPNITDVGESDAVTQALTVQSTIGFLLKDVLGVDWIVHQIDTYCNAQKHVIQQTFDKFVRRVYRQGMGEIVSTCKQSGMSGKFGETELRTLVCAGRVMFTFARRIDRTKKGFYKKGDGFICNEKNISFVASEDDLLCLSAGLQSVNADFRTALDLMEDVIKYWPQDSKEQKKVFKADENISFA